jgi:uncharacterized protein YkwD
MKTRILGFTLALAAPLLVEPAAAQALTPAAYQRQVFSATNNQRERHDRVEFRHQTCVQKYAVRQAKRMARQDRMYHQDLGPILRDCGLRTVGENVAYGYPSGRSAVTRGWMHSEGHRRNILSPAFRLLGTGARQSADGTWYAAQVFGGR